MQAQATVARDGLAIAHGYGIKIRVHRQHLVIDDGAGLNRRTRQYHAATSKLKRLIVIGRTGYVTLEALRWLNDTKAALVHLDPNGELIACSAAGGPGLAALRRAQALAATNQTGIEIARFILRTKVAGQSELLKQLPEGAENTESLTEAAKQLDNAEDLTGLLAAEAQAASGYWRAWSELPIPFPRGDAAKLPAHWLTFGQRASALTGGPRLATNPSGAILNFVYSLLEAETTLALQSVGLDPLLGIFHTDQRHRNSLALDAMEPVRPIVDAYVLALLTQRTLAR